jgi:3-phenylpropionate/trans-cinnamate dioxygenase ferredoxin subunit
MAEAHFAAPAAEIPSGTARRVVVAGTEILICNVDGHFYAIEDVCTHDGAPLDQGLLEGARITCPRHGAMFDVTTGEVLALPAVMPLPTFPVETRDGDVYVVV